MRSVGEIAWHISHGRIDWFRRLEGPGAGELFDSLTARAASHEALAAGELVDWLQRTWLVVEATLAEWTVEDLDATFEQTYQGKVYAVSRQWVIWRIMAHDIQHGGQLSELLAQQGIFPTELTWLGGHLTEPEILRDA